MSAAEFDWFLCQTSVLADVCALNFESSNLTLDFEAPVFIFSPHVANV